MEVESTAGAIIKVVAVVTMNLVSMMRIGL